MPETINPTQEVTMPATITAAEAAAIVPGTIATGSVVEVLGTEGPFEVLASSFTAYRVRRQGGATAEAWVPFSAIHGRPAFVAPLVTFG